MTAPNPICHLFTLRKVFDEPSKLLWIFFFLLYFSLAEKEPEAKPQNVTEDIEKKKQKKQKKMSNIESSSTGFQEAFEQFATSANNNSKITVGASDIPADNKLDVSATQVSCLTELLDVN